MQWIKAIDIKFFYFFNQTAKNSLFDTIMPIITDLGIWYYLIILTMLFCIPFRRKGFYPFFLTSLSVYSSRWICRVFKIIFDRPRPRVSLKDVHVLGTEYFHYSFPSGHTTVVFAFAAILAIKIPKIRIPVFIIAVLVGFSRIYVGAHYPSDVIAGAVLGCAISAIILFIEAKVTKKKN